ncbi:MAG: VWA domain-containing protein, partial [Pirellulales bacterium]|nr:VWA domain-containing protein [Pirellulales bacterium]
MSGTLPDWLAGWLGLDAAGSGQAIAWELAPTWTWAPWVSVVFVVATVAVIVSIYRRDADRVRPAMRWLLISMRLAVVFLVAFVMLFQVVLKLSRAELPYVALLIDDSLSMETTDSYEPSELARLVERLSEAGIDLSEGDDSTALARISLAKLLLLDDDAKMLDQIRDKYKLRIYGVGGEQIATTEDDLDAIRQQLIGHGATGTSSPLGLRLQQVMDDLRGLPVAAIVYLTDGINTEGPSLAEAGALARRRGIQLFTVGVGDQRLRRDLWVDDLVAEQVVFVNDIATFDFKLNHRGFAGRTVDVQLRVEGQSQPVATERVKIDPSSENQGTQQVRMLFRPQEQGTFRFRVGVEVLDDEVNPDNNVSQPVVVSVRDAKFKVLLVQAYPSYEYRFLKNVLERDEKSIELKTFLQEADPEYAATDSTALRVFPLRSEELNQFDVILFGDVNPEELSHSAMENIVQFVEKKGGGIAFMAGPQFTPLAFANTPLAKLLPIELSTPLGPPVGRVYQKGYDVEPTELGWALPQMQLGENTNDSEMIWRSQLPHLYWLLTNTKLRPGAKAVAMTRQPLPPQDRRLPVIAMQYYGAGKVILHLTDDSWRWRYRNEDVLPRRYWFQTIRYLARSARLGGTTTTELAPVRDPVFRGENVRLRTRFFDEGQAPADDQGVEVMVQQGEQPATRHTLSRAGGSRGIFVGDLGPLAVGQYRAWIVEPAFADNPPSTTFQVLLPKGETERLEMDQA